MDNAKLGYLESSLFFQLVVINFKINNLHNTAKNFQKALVMGFNQFIFPQKLVISCQLKQHSSNSTLRCSRQSHS